MRFHAWLGILSTLLFVIGGLFFLDGLNARLNSLEKRVSRLERMNEERAEE